MTTSEMRVTRAETVRDRLLNGLPMTERRLQLAGVSTAVLEGGDGPPIVLLHGPGEYAPKFVPVLPDLVTTHSVIAPDLPGHGESGVMDNPGLDGMLCSTAPLSPELARSIEKTCGAPLLEIFGSSSMRPD